MKASQIHVAVGVIRDRRGRVLISERPDHVHQGGLWEFPGGKVEPGESVRDALARELREELGITVHRSRPLIQVRHRYTDRSVFLDVYVVEDFAGEPHGREGQPVAWVETDALRNKPFPEANEPIMQAARLPDRYLITPKPDEDETVFLQGLEASLADGIQLVQFRAPDLPVQRFERLGRAARTLCARHDVPFLVNADPETATAWEADGVHINSRRLMALRRRPLPKALWVGASCHDAAQLARAQDLGVDFCVLGPVRQTASHPGARGMGWGEFERLTRPVNLPVFGLGGLAAEDTRQAWESGAQGIAGITGLWRGLEGR